MSYQIVYTRRARDDIALLKSAKLDGKAKALIALLAEEPYRSPPPFEKLKGDLEGACSRRLNRKHRLVYQVVEEAQTVKILRMWTHYE